MALFSNRSKLKTDLLLLVILAVTLLTIVSSTVQLYLEYRNKIRSVEANLQFIADSHLSPIIDSLWDFDKSNVRLQLKGLLKLPGIKYCVINDDDGILGSTIEEGNSKLPRDLIRQYPLRHRNTSLGTLMVAANFDHINNELLAASVVIFASYGCLVLSIAFMILVISNHVLFRHFSFIADYTAKLDIDHLDEPLTLERLNKEDELQQIVNAINEMRSRIQRGIEEKQNMQLQLEYNHNVLKAQQEASWEGILVVDGNGLVVSRNRRFNEIWQINEELPDTDSDDHLIQQVLDLLMDPEAFQYRIQHLYSHKDKTSKDTIYFRDGRIVERRSSPIYGKGRHYFGRVWYYRDITDRKRIEDQLRHTNNIINRSPFVVFLWKNAHGWPVEYVSENVRALFGYSAQEFISGKALFANSIHPDDLDRVGQEVKQHSDEADRTDFIHEPYRIITKAGGIKWISDLTRIRRDSGGKITHYEGIVYDITDRKHAEEELDRSVNFTRALLKAVPTPIFYKDKEGLYQGCNRAFSTFMGVTPEDIKGKRVDELWPSEQAKIYHRKDLELLRNPAHQVYEYEVRDKKGEIRPVIYAKDVFYDEDGKTAGIIGAFLDITEVKKKEKELSRLRNYLSNIIDSMPSVLIGVDKKSLVTQWNSEAQRVTGVSSESATGQPVEKVFPRLAIELDRIKDAIRMRQTYSDSRKPRKEGEKLLYENIIVYPLATNGAEGAVIRIDDVTEQVRLEEMMVQSEKMLSVGGLAAGMAHEINNPLAGMMHTALVMANRLGDKLHIGLNCEAAEAAGTTPEAIEKFMQARNIPRMLATINESGRRVKEIVDNMLSFSRKSDDAVSSHSIEKLVEKSLELAATDYDLKKQYDFKRIEVERDYESGSLSVPCNASKIQQVLLNIFSNGAQAMQSAETKNPRFMIQTRFDKERKMACIKIRDNGPGMDKETCKRVFEPFFTTKPIGMGTGLGLSVSYFIITENHNGEMEVDSSPGSGTIFVVRLPLTAKGDGHMAG